MGLVIKREGSVVIDGLVIKMEVVIDGLVIKREGWCSN